MSARPDTVGRWDVQHVEAFVPVRIQSLLDHRSRSGLLASYCGHSEGIWEAYRTVSQRRVCEQGDIVLRKTSRLYRPSAAITRGVSGTNLQSRSQHVLVTRRLGVLETIQYVTSPASRSLILTEVDPNP